MKRRTQIIRLVILFIYVSYSLLFLTLNLEPDPEISISGAIFCFLLGVYSVIIIVCGYFQKWNWLSLAIITSLALYLLYDLQQFFAAQQIAYWFIVLAVPAVFELIVFLNRLDDTNQPAIS